MMIIYLKNYLIKNYLQDHLELIIPLLLKDRNKDYMNVIFFLN